MEQTTADILKEVEMLLMRADLRAAMINGELDKVHDPMKDSTILEIQLGLEIVEQLTTKLENTLLKKINQALRKRLSQNKK